MDIKRVKVDAARGERGDWIGDIPGMGDLRLHVRGFANTDYTAFIVREVGAAPKEQREGGRVGAALLPNVRDAITTRGIVEHILLGWENLTEGDEPVAYSKEMAMNYLSDPDFRVFSAAVEWAAGQVDQIRAEEVRGASGNS